MFRSAWGTLQNNFKALFIGILLYFMPSLIIAILNLVWQNDPYMLVSGPAAFLQLILGLYIFFTAPLYMGYTTSILRTYHMTGNPARMETAWAAAKANYGRYLLTMLALVVITFAAILIIALIAGITAAVPLASMISAHTSSVSAMWSVMTPALIVMTVLMLLYSLCISFVQFIPGMEFPSAFQAVFQSFRYVFRGNFWKTLGHMAVIGVILVAIDLLILIPFYIPYFSVLLAPGMTLDSIQAATLALSAGMTVYSLIVMVIGLFTQIFVTPYQFEVYLNAKNVSDAKNSQQMRTAYDPYAGFAQNQPPQQNTQPPQIPPEERK